MDAFHREEVQLERVNRSYMVLLPKKPGLLALIIPDYKAAVTNQEVY